MDSVKMGELIRQARKERGLTKKEIADQLGITDRAVSKWERGLCAPDIALLDPLGELLGLSVTELISCERKPVAENTEQIETAVKETITYSQNEMLTKNRLARHRLTLVTLIGIILSILICLGILWYKGMFHILGRFPSPDGTTVTTFMTAGWGMAIRRPPVALLWLTRDGSTDELFMKMQNLRVFGGHLAGVIR